MNNNAKLVVLLAEGDRIARDLLAMALAGAGFDLIQAGTGEAALSILRRERARIDFIVAGANLPALVSGAMLADEFAGIRPGVRTILGSAGGGVIAHAAALPAPLSPNAVLATLQQLAAGGATPIAHAA